MRAWDAGGADALMSGLRQLLLKSVTEEEIRYSAQWPSGDDARNRATLLIEEAIERRTEKLGRSLMAEFVRAVILDLINAEWRQFLIRVEFLRRQSYALYDPASIIEQRAADITALFAAYQQTIRADAIKYFLEIEPIVTGS